MPNRDDDYLRDLLLGFEEQEDWQVIAIDGMRLSDDDRKRRQHILLMWDAGLMTPTSPSGDIFRITSQGYDYLAAIRDESIWKKTKEGASQLGGVTLGLMKDIALAYVKQQALEKLGVTL